MFFFSVRELFGRVIVGTKRAPGALGDGVPGAGLFQKMRRETGTPCDNSAALQSRLTENYQHLGPGYCSGYCCIQKEEELFFYQARSIFFQKFDRVVGRVIALHAPFNVESNNAQSFLNLSSGRACQH